MESLDAELAIRALEATGALLTAWQNTRADLVLAGGTAGLLGHLLSPTRVTADCDVMWVNDPGAWAEIERAAVHVAESLGLPPHWLNRECSTYSWTLMLGWRTRCEPVGIFGPLQVLRLGRIDLIATKVIGAPWRPQDLEDLIAMRPTASEVERISGHLDRLAAEDLDGRTFDRERRVLASFGASI